ncbi:MAG: hypothetical protein KTR31_31325 [Myxococcales bacterium]|nr:hypothetical protein [Myxococcales bacterium]
MIWFVGPSALAAPSLEVGVALGGRTAPESVIQVPEVDEGEPGDTEEVGEEEDGEFEPSVLLLADARGRVTAGAVWGAVDATAWLLAPEGEADRLTASPQVGVGAAAGAVRADAVGRYLLDLFPFRSSASSGRAEIHGGLDWQPPEARIGAGLHATLVDRHFFAVPEWGFRTIEAGATARLGGTGPVWLELGLAGQGNQGLVRQEGGLEREWGSQLRGMVGVGVSTPAAYLQLRLRPLWAFAGELDDDTVRAQFTPLGDYAEDADALSAGGFQQQRLDVQAAVQPGRWTVSAGVLGRLRRGAASQTLLRTGHAYLLLARPVSGPWSLRATLGVAGAEPAGGQSFVDIYGWAGVRWRPVLRSEEDEPNAP